jgi:hypothetical protein
VNNVKQQQQHTHTKGKNTIAYDVDGRRVMRVADIVPGALLLLAAHGQPFVPTANKLTAKVFVSFVVSLFRYCFCCFVSFDVCRGFLFRNVRSTSNCCANNSRPTPPPPTTPLSQTTLHRHHRRRRCRSRCGAFRSARR